MENPHDGHRLSADLRGSRNLTLRAATLNLLYLGDKSPSMPEVGLAKHGGHFPAASERGGHTKDE